MTETVEDKNFRSQRNKITLKFKKEDQEIMYQKEEYTRKCSTYKRMLIIIYIAMPIWLIYDIIKYNSNKNDNKVSEKEKKINQFFLLFESLFLVIILFEYLLVKYVPKMKMCQFLFITANIYLYLCYMTIYYFHDTVMRYLIRYFYIYIYIYISFYRFVIFMLIIFIGPIGYFNYISAIIFNISGFIIYYIIYHISSQNNEGIYIYIYHYIAIYAYGEWVLFLVILGHTLYKSENTKRSIFFLHNSLRKVLKSYKYNIYHRDKRTGRT